MEMITVPGNRRGSIYYTCNADRGFFYKINKTKNGIKFLICVEKGCPGRASANVSHFIKVGGQHNHLPDINKQEALQLKQSMLEKATSTSEDIKSIFVTQSASASVEVASKIAFPALSKAMRRQRRLVQPDMPETLEELGHVCEDNPLYGRLDDAKFCWGTVGVGDSASVLFIAENLIPLLSDTKEIHIDGTFKTRPRHPPSSQLLTIMAVQYGYAFPCVFALMQSRKAEAYDQIFRKIVQILPYMRVKFIMSDFEKALSCSLERNFPNVDKAGCFFHYGQAILRKASTLGLTTLLRDNRQAKKALKLLICLALLPSDKVEEGLSYVSDFIRENRLSEDLNTLLTYHRRQWMTRVGADGFSVYNRTRRTNNDSESFHSLLQRLLRVRGPNVWQFINKIQDITKATVREIHAFVDEGLEIKVLPKRSYRANNRRIKQASAKFEEDGDVWSFLNSVTYTVERMVQITIAYEEEQDDEEEFLLAPLPGVVPPQFALDNNAASNSDTSEDEAVEAVQQQQEVHEQQSTHENATTNLGNCLVCQDAAPTYILMPCGHFGMCTPCAERMQHLRATPQVPDEDWGHTINYEVCPLDRRIICDYVKVINT